MSTFRVITRIIPSNASPEDCSSLLSASDIDYPQTFESTTCRDPVTGNMFWSETIFCKENIVPPGVDIDRAVASRCEEIPGLVCLRKSRMHLVTDSYTHGPPIIKVTSSQTSPAMTEGLNGGILVSLPLRLSRADIPKTPVMIVPDTLNHRSTPNNLYSNNYDGTNSLPTVHYPYNISNSYDTNSFPLNRMIEPTTSDYTLFSDLIHPLKKYIKDNKCMICGFESHSKSSSTIEKHMGIHIQGRHFFCNICGKAFKGPGNLRSHQKSHAVKVCQPLECETCGSVFKTRVRLNAHARSHLPRDMPCSFCDITFNSKTRLRNHLRIHTGELPYSCPVCSDKFRTSKSLQIHKLSHETHKKYQCEVCGKAYNFKKIRDDHMKTHTGESLYSCELCDKKFNFRANLSQHRKVHKENRNHGCLICGKQFKFKHHLKNHMAIHSQTDVEEDSN